MKYFSWWGTEVVFCLSQFFVCFLKFEITVDSNGTTETDRYCSDMDFSVLNENVTLYQKQVKETDY